MSHLRALMYLKELTRSVRLPDIFLPAVLAVLSGLLFYNNYFISLTAVPGGMVGTATCEGIDIGARVSKFYYTGIITAVSLLLLVWLYHLTIKYLHIRKANRIVINTLSLLSLITIFFSFCFSSQWNPIAKIFVGYTLVTCLYVFVASWLSPALRLSWDRLCFAMVSAIAFTVTATDMANLTGTALQHNNIPILLAIIFYGIFLLLFHRVPAAGFKRLLKTGIAVSLLPLLYFFTNETFAILYARTGIIYSQASIYFLLLTILLLAGILLYFTKPATSGKKLISIISLLFCIAVAVTTHYQSILPELENDEFEAANQVNALMNIFRFHQVPFIDFFTSHLLTDFLPGLVYYGLYGYSPDMNYQVYFFIYQVIGYVSIFLLIDKIFPRRWFALFFVIVLTWIAAIQIPSVFSIPVLCFLAFTRFSGKKTLKSFLVLSLMLVIAIVWRIDVAVSTIPVIVLLLLVWAFASGQWALLRRAFLAAAALWLCVAALVFIIWGFPPVENLQTALGYIGGSQAHGLPGILNGDVFLVNTRFFIFPFLVLLLCTIAASRYFKRQLSLSTLLTIAFFAGVYLINFQRGLVRHVFTFGEPEYYLSSVIYFLIPFGIISLYKIRRFRIWIFTGISLLFILAFKTPDKPASHMLLSGAIDNISNRKFLDSESIKQLRVPGFAPIKHKYEGLDSFMRNNFDPDATLLDVSISPAVYYCLQRPVPSYFCQYMQNLVTEKQQLLNIKRLQKYDVPVAIVSSYPEHPFFDMTDGVPNPLRYYIISNYIYNNYTPFGVVSGKNIWLKKDEVINFNNTALLPDSITFMPKHYAINKLALLLGNTKAGKDTRELLPQLNDSTWVLPREINKEQGNYLLVDIQNTLADQTATISYTNQEKELGSFSFYISSGGQQKYMIPVSTQYNWHALTPSLLVFRNNLTNNGITIKSVSLHNGL